eukprot:3355266-Ditylum_brightwellii.AAC.1
MMKTCNDVDTKSSTADDSKSPTTMQMFQQIMAHLDNQKEQLSNVTITSQQNIASIAYLSLIVDTNKKEILQRCNNIRDKYDSVSSQLSAITSSNKQSINNMSEKITADKVEMLNCYNAMNDTSEKMEA